MLPGRNRGVLDRLVAAVGELDEPVAIRPEHVYPLRRVVGQIGEARGEGRTDCRR